MTVPFAVNGFGRIGRALVRVAHRRPELGLVPVAVNDLAPAATLARLLARDTVHGPFAAELAADGEALIVAGRRVAVGSAAEPGECRWEESGARVVVEASGRFLAREAAAGHLGGCVERVVLSANSDDADVTLCLGVNDGDYDPAQHRVVSNASCTTNCVAPLARVLDDGWGLARGAMTTVHPYTVNQRLLDGPHAEVRRMRAAAANVIPIATSAPSALGRVLPHLAGKLAGVSVRVPTPAAAMMELVAELAADADPADLAAAFRAAAVDGPLAAVLAVSDEELVSSDYVGHPASAVVDLPLTTVVDRRLARVVAWYDNEWGYANRLAELVSRLGTA